MRTLTLVTGVAGFIGFHVARRLIDRGDHIIGLFQGMFEKNILTFNPGWDQDARPLAEFTAARNALASAPEAPRGRSCRPGCGAR